MNYTLQTHTRTCEHVCVYVNVCTCIIGKHPGCIGGNKAFGCMAVSHLFNKLPIGQREYFNSEIFQLEHKRCWYMEIEYNYMYHLKAIVLRRYIIVHALQRLM